MIQDVALLQEFESAKACFFHASQNMYRIVFIVHTVRFMQDLYSYMDIL